MNTLAATEATLDLWEKRRNEQPVGVLIDMTNQAPNSREAAGDGGRSQFSADLFTTQSGVLLPGPNHPAYWLLGLVCGYHPDYRDKKLMLMLKGYVDESGNDGKSDYLVLAGYVLPFGNWTRFIEDWQTALNRAPKIKYFHMVDAESRKREFAHLDKPFRKLKVNELLGVIEKHELTGLAAYVRLSAWQKFLVPHVKAGFESPYYPLFDAIVKLLVRYSVFTGNELPVTFIFDEKADVVVDAVRIYQHLKLNAETIPQMCSLFGGTPSFEDDKKVLPLQAADMLAWHWRRHLDYPDEKRESWERVLKTVSFQQELDEEYLLSMIPHEGDV